MHASGPAAGRGPSQIIAVEVDSHKQASWRRREFVVQVLKAVFRMNEDQAYRVMITAHKRGTCVVAVFARDVAESKATEATELGKGAGYPLLFTTQPEE
jgi:ATP-dependent Clp protease adapter protein ClpS